MSNKFESVTRLLQFKLANSLSSIFFSSMRRAPEFWFFFWFVCDVAEVVIIHKTI